MLLLLDKDLWWTVLIVLSWLAKKQSYQLQLYFSPGLPIPSSPLSSQQYAFSHRHCVKHTIITSHVLSTHHRILFYKKKKRKKRLRRKSMEGLVCLFLHRKGHELPQFGGEIQVNMSISNTVCLLFTHSNSFSYRSSDWHMTGFLGVSLEKNYLTF